jgi:outer membrane receptor (OMR) family iron transporter
MNRKNHNILFAVLPLGLAACGGGSGGDNPTVDNKPQQLGKTANYIGAIFMAPANQSSAHETVGTNDSSNLTLTTSNGDRFILPRTSEGANQRGNMLIYGSATGKDGHFTAPDNRSYQSFQVSDNSYAYTQFGFAYASDNTLGGFYRGQPVGSMPTSGTATYRGDAIVATFNGENFNKTELGTVRADADFAARKLQFSLNSASHQGSIDAAIDNNLFIGANSNNSVGGVFYGPNAEEIAGSYSAAGVFAVYGAKR